jgi:DNA-binding MarR family transcriptional regulator
MSPPNPHTDGGSSSSARPPAIGLGSALRRAWLGYQHRLDTAMADAGFGERRFPDGRVLRLCSDRGSTISAIGRELGITRQGASKVVGQLRDCGYVVVEDSATSGREKSVILTDLGANYLREHWAAARAIEKELRAQLGESAFSSLMTLIDTLGQDEQQRMQTYIRGSTRSH